MSDLCKHCSDMMGGSWPMLGSKCTCGNRALPAAEVCEHGHFRRACEVCELKAKIARLRSVCRMASRAITDDIRNAAIDGVARKKLVLFVEDLRDNGKEPSDGTH